jgi:hypothetical protein
MNDGALSGYGRFLGGCYPKSQEGRKNWLVESSEINLYLKGQNYEEVIKVVNNVFCSMWFVFWEFVGGV